MKSGSVPEKREADKKFTTYQRDAESGLDYAMNRYVANATGRFSSPDKSKAALFSPTSLNRYTFPNLDPINNTDPTGNECGDGQNCLAGPQPPQPTDDGNDDVPAAATIFCKRPHSNRIYTPSG
jgi:RHS repeat-associated protein